MECRLLPTVINLWKSRPREVTIMRVHMETEIPFHWLVHFSKGRVRNPPVDYIERLYVYFTGKELSL